MTRLVRKPKIPAKKGEKAPAWPLQDAKARLSEVVRLARETGPQHITVHGRDTAVILSSEDFAKLTIHAKYPTLSSLLADSPLRDVEFDFEPVRMSVRPVDL